MTDEERELLLATARILRAHLRDSAGTHDSDCARDAADLSEALRPFESNVTELHPASTPSP